ncbi:MAG: hypothetical protein IJ728_12205, partial [Selenomonadaceae bacterium]|nr:hypothetical protein [Selenomonadaceae bacterium]
FTGTLDYTDYESTVTKINASKVTNSIYAIGNAKNNSIKTGIGDDTLDGGSDGNDTLTGGKGSDVFIYRGGNDLITDYTAGEDTIKIASGTIDTYAIKSSNVVLTIGDNTLTIKNAKNKEITITNSSGSTSTITYPTVPAGLTYNSGLTMLTADENFTGSEIDLANYVSTVTKVNATKLTSAVKITGNSKSNSLVGGSGNDTLDGSTGTNKLTGGDGSDVFIYNGDGSTTILDYAEGVDKIKINDSITSAKASGTNFIFTVGSKKLTVKNGAKQKITVVDSTNKTSYYGSILNVTDSDKAKITATTYVATIDASERTTDINIVGNKLANTIYGGSGVNTINGGAGADYIVGGNKGNSLVGGAGKDTLIGGSGNDSFIGGADGNIFIAGVGADYIKDYSAKDTIKLASGSLTSATLNNSDVIIETSLGSITLKSAKNKQVTVVDSNDNTLMSQTFNNSITSYSNYDERWFIEDELIGNDDLNEIVNDDISLLTTNENEEINAVQFENASQSIEQSHIGRRKNLE